MNTLRKLSDFAGKYMAILSLAVAVAALFIPHAFTWAAPHITMLLGIVMFGMGLTLKLSDFREVFRRPKDVFAGFVFQFTVMPVVAFLLAKIFRLPPELAVGVILVGTCPGGTSFQCDDVFGKGRCGSFRQYDNGIHSGSAADDAVPHMVACRNMGAGLILGDVLVYL
jgi:bile acid:Na+ symporter, BASS family